MCTKEVFFKEFNFYFLLSRGENSHSFSQTFNRSDDNYDPIKNRFKTVCQIESVSQRFPEKFVKASEHFWKTLIALVWKQEVLLKLREFTLSRIFAEIS